MTRKIFGKFSAAVLRQMAYKGYQSYIGKPERRHMVEDAMEAELESRLEYAKHMVSLWSHACLSDGLLSDQEDTAVAEMIGTLFGDDASLFPEAAVNLDTVMDELSDIFQEPYPMSRIILFAKQHKKVPLSFYEDCCYLTASDEVIEKKERKFLDKLSQDLGISREDKKKVDSNYKARKI